MVRNMDFNMAAFAVSLLIFIFFKVMYRQNTKSNKAFGMLVLSICLTSLGNVLSDWSIKLSAYVTPHLTYFIYGIYLVLVISTPFFLSVYTDSLIVRVNDKPKRFWTVFNWSLFGIHVLFCLLNVKLHIYIVINKDLTLSRGPVYALIYCFSGYYLLFALVNILRYIHKLNERQIISVVAFVTLTILGAVSQFLIFGDNIVIYFIYTVASMILMFCFETPDYAKLMETTNSLEESEKKLKKAKKKEEQLTSTVHQLMKSAAWDILFDDKGYMVEAEWSPEFTHMLGYEEGEFTGDITTLWTESLHPEDLQRTLSAFMAGLRTGGYNEECRLRDRYGNYAWYRCSGEVIKAEDGNSSYQGIIQNIEDEKYKAELINERLKAMEELEQSQDQLKKALFAAEEANRSKTIFLSNMSHDIRTPMNAIIGFTQLALEHPDDKDNLLDSLKTIRSSGEHLLSLINDVLDMSRIESGNVKVEPVPCNILEIVKEIGNLTHANMVERGHTYKADCSEVVHPYVICDRLRINQILINCIGNSVKYTNNGGLIEFTVKENVKEDGSDFVFIIKDNGIGMSEEFVKKIFEPFEREKTSTISKIQGTGLGMAITKNLIDMMNGTVEVQSKLNEGSVFTITIPLKTISEADYSAAENEGTLDISIEEMEAALKDKRFLVVDDNAMNRKLIKRLLTEKGMYLEECESGSAAIDRLSDIKPGEFDMVFMDIQMPGIDGYTTTEMLRQKDNPVLKEIPIIAMTANAFEEDKQKAKQHGMNAHVSKPFKINELITVLYSMLVVKN